MEYSKIMTILSDQMLNNDDDDKDRTNRPFLLTTSCDTLLLTHIDNLRKDQVRELVVQVAF
ncbi:MAG: hypothetical protein AB7U98_11165 [Candidatus Nitrosocosmicus sp.]|uniref:hypothetical protein n=1 Tax=Candidatus Nitrosocosmicus sp. FF01 TaxID=3397670 RepID=UPI0039E8B0D0